LVGAPKYVGGAFSCCDTELESLQGCPQVVKSHFHCYHNIVSFDESDIREVCDVGGEVFLHHNQ